MEYRLFQLPDGNYVQVPKNDPFEVANAWARANFPDSYKSAIAQETPKEGFFENLKAGTRRAVSETGLGIGSLIDEQRARQAYAADKTAEDARGVKTVGLEDVKKAYNERGLLAAMGQLPPAARDLLAQSAPQMAATLAGAKAGAMAGTAIAPVAGTIGGALIGGMAVGVPMFLGSNFASQHEAAPTQEFDKTAAVAAAVGQSLLDTASNLFVLGKALGITKLAGVPIPVLAKTTPEVAQAKLVQEAQRSLLAATGRGVAKGVATEMPTEVAQQVLERAQAGLPLLDADAVREYQESAFGGALLGGVLGGAAGPVETMQARGQVRRDEAEAAVARRAGEIEAERQKKEAEEAAKKSPEYVQQLAEKFKTYAEQRAAFVQREKELGKPTPGSVEALEKAQLRAKRQEFEKANEKLLQEVKERLPEVKAALFDADEFMSSLETGPRTTQVAPTRRGEETAPIVVGPDGIAQPSTQEDVKTRLNNIVLDLKEGMAFTGVPPSADAIVKAFAEDPEVLQYVATSPDALPGFDKSLSKLIKQHADTYRRGQIRAQQQAEAKENVLAKDQSGLIGKPAPITDTFPERLAELATQPTEATVPRAYTPEKSTIPPEKPVEGPPEFAQTVEELEKAGKITWPEVEKEDVAADRIKGIQRLEARIKELDDIVKATAGTPYGFGEQEFQAAAAQKERDKLIAQLQQVKRDMARAEQRKRSETQADVEARRKESAVQAALESAFGPGTTNIDEDTQTLESAYREAFGRFTEAISDWIGAKNLPDTVSKKAELVQKNKDAVVKAKHALALFAAKRIQFAREANGLEPLTMDSATLHKMLMQRIDRAFRDVVNIEDRPQRKQAEPASTPASIAREKRIALNDRFLNNVRKFLKQNGIFINEGDNYKELKEQSEALAELTKTTAEGVGFGKNAPAEELQRIAEIYKKRVDSEIARIEEAAEKQAGPRTKPWRLDERRRQATILRQLIEVRRKLRALEDASPLTTERRSTGAASPFAPNLRATEKEKSRLQAAERNLVEQQNTPFAMYRMQRDIQPLIDQLSIKGTKTKKRIDFVDKKSTTATRIQGDFLGRQYLNKEKIEKERQQDEEDARRAATNAELSKQGFVNRFPGDTEGMTEAQKAEYLSARQPDLLEYAYETEAEKKKGRVKEATDAENAADWRIHFKRREIENALAALQAPAVRKQVDAALARADAAHVANYNARKKLRLFKPTKVSEDILFNLKEYAKTNTPYERTGIKNYESVYAIIQRLQKAVDDTAAEYNASARRLEALVGYKLPEAEATDATTVTTELFRKATAPLRLKQAAKSTKEAAIIDALKAYREIEDVALSKPLQPEQATVKYPYQKEYRETIVTGKEAEKELLKHAPVEAKRFTLTHKRRNALSELASLTEKPSKDEDSELVAANKKLQKQLDAYNNSFAEAKQRIAVAETALNKTRDAAIEAGKKLRELTEKTGKKITPWQSVNEPTPLERAETEYENAEKAYRAAYDSYESAIKRADAHIDAARIAYIKAVDQAIDISEHIAELKTEIANINNDLNELPSSEEYDKLMLNIARAKAMANTRFKRQKTALEGAQERYEESKKASEEKQRKLELLYGKSRKIDKQSPYELTAPWAPVRERAPTTGAGTYGTLYYEEKVDEGAATAREAKAEKRAQSGKDIEELRKKLSQKQYKKLYNEGKREAVAANVPEAEQNAFAHRYAANKIAELASQEFERAVQRGEKETQIRPYGFTGAQAKGLKTGVKESGKAKIVRREKAVQNTEIETTDVGETGIDFGGSDVYETPKKMSFEDQVRKYWPAKDGTEFTNNPLHGKSLAEAAQYGYERARSPIRKALFSALKSILKDSTGKIVATRVPGTLSRGLYHSTDDKIELNYRNAELAKVVDLDVLLHELAHAATVKGLNFDPELNKEISALRKIVQDYLDSKEGKKYVRSKFGLSNAKNYANEYSEKSLHALKNNKEFLAEAFANKQFQDLLMQIPSQNKRPNLWSRFVHAVAKFLGAVNPKEIGLLADVMSVAEKAMDTVEELNAKASSAKLQDRDSFLAKLNARLGKDSNTAFESSKLSWLNKLFGKNATIVALQDFVRDNRLANEPIVVKNFAELERLRPDIARKVQNIEAPVVVVGGLKKQSGLSRRQFLVSSASALSKYTIPDINPSATSEDVLAFFTEQMNKLQEHGEVLQKIINANNPGKRVVDVDAWGGLYNYPGSGPEGGLNVNNPTERAIFEFLWEVLEGNDSVVVDPIDSLNALGKDKFKIAQDILNYATNDLSKRASKILAELGAKEAIAEKAAIVVFSNKLTNEAHLSSELNKLVQESKEQGEILESPKSIHDDPNTEEAYSTMIGGKGTWDAFKENFLGLGFRVRFVDSDAASVAAFKKGDPVAAIQAEYNLMKYRNKNHLVHQSVFEGPVQQVKAKIHGQDAYVIEAQENGPTLANAIKLLSEVVGFGNTQATAEAFSLYELGNRAKDLGWERIFADLKAPQNASPAQIAEIAKENAARAKARQRATNLANDPDTIAKFKKAHEEYQAWNKGMLRFAMQSGVISEEEYRRLSAKGNYTPAFRADQNNNLVLEIDAGQTITVGKIQDEAMLQQLRGGSGKLMDFFHASVLNASILVDASLHNQAAKTAVFTLQAMGLAHPVGENEKSPDIIEFRNKGEKDRQRFRIETEAVGIPTHLIVKGFEGVPSSMPGIIRVLGMPAQLLRRAVTRNPLYMARQLVRDPMSAWLATGADFNPIYDTIKEVSKAVGGLSDKTLDRRGITGGMMFAEDETDLNTLAKQMAGANPLHIGWWSAKLDHAALGADAVIRRMVYEGAIKEGLSEHEAELAAWKSMPFSKRGTSPSVRVANHIIPFLSASIQGWDTMYRAIKGDMPLHERVNVRNKLLARGMMIAGLSMMYAAAMEDDDDYRNQDTQVRLKNWIIRVPGTDLIVKVPVPFEHGIIWKMIPEALYRAAVSDEDAGDEAKAIGKALWSMVPLQLPQAILPLVEVAQNKSFFTDTPIENRSLQNLEVSERYDDKTSEVSKWLGQLSSIAGVSPKKLEYMLGAYTAGLYPAMAAMLDTMIPAYSETNKPTKSLAQMPVIKSVLAQEDATGEVSRLYDKIESMTEFSRTLKHLAETQPERVQEYFEENSKKIAAGSAAEKMKANLDKFAAIENKIRSVPASAMTPDQKKDALDRVRAAKIAAARQMNASLRALAA